MQKTITIALAISTALSATGCAFEKSVSVFAFNENSSGFYSRFITV